MPVKSLVLNIVVSTACLFLSACGRDNARDLRTSAESDITCHRADLQKDFFDRGMIPVQAHRGGGFALPENTMETFRAAWALGMIPEADIRMTKDDAIVCIHDDNTKRLAPDTPAPLNKLKIGEMTLEQVKSLDVGSFRNKPGERIPALEEVFHDMQKDKRRMIFLDYKYVNMERLARLVRRYGLASQVVFTTQDYDLIRRWCRLLPGATSMLWMNGNEQKIEENFANLRKSDFAGISILQIHVRYNQQQDSFSPSLEFLGARRSELQKKQILPQVLPWEISEPSVFDRLMAEGFRSFATDYCQTVLDVYKAGIKKYGPVSSTAPTKPSLDATACSTILSTTATV